MLSVKVYGGVEAQLQVFLTYALHELHSMPVEKVTKVSTKQEAQFNNIFTIKIGNL